MPANILAALPNGVCVLTESGELGVRHSEDGVLIQEDLTRVLAGHIRDFIQRYRSGPHTEERRIAIVYHSAQTHPWGKLTFSLEDSALQHFYPVGNRNGSSLTVFQQKKREMSIYRGMEMMLATEPQSPGRGRGYCPVVYLSPSRLAERSSARGLTSVDNPQDTPVLDVLNLCVGHGTQKTIGEALATLASRLRDQVVRKEMRRESDFSLLGKLESSTPQSVESPYGDIERDKRLQRQVTLPSVDARRLHETERLESIERWLCQPEQAIEPGKLRTFAQFRAADDDSLRNLAPRCLTYAAPTGIRLIDRNLSDAWNFYLLQGSVMLTPADGQTLRIDAGTEKASYPIAFLKPRIYSVNTLTPVLFLWVHDMLLQAVKNEESRNIFDEASPLRNRR